MSQIFCNNVVMVVVLIYILNLNNVDIQFIFILYCENNIMERKAMLNFALSAILNGGKHMCVSFIQV